MVHLFPFRFLTLLFSLSSELYMLTDKSPEFTDTWSFLDRRVNDITSVAELPHQVQSLAEMACQFVSRSFGRRS